MATTFSAYATAQNPDRLIVKGDTMLLHALPLGQWIEQNNFDRPLFPDSLSIFNTGCWRGYVAYWEIVDNQLYLSNIYNEDHSAKVNLDSLFTGKVHNGRVHADWFSDTVTAYKGKCVYYVHAGFSSIYEHEFEYVFDNGKLINSAYFDNSMSTRGDATMYRNAMKDTINSLIDWANLPIIESQIKVVLTVEVNKLGNVDSVLRVRGDYDVFNQEAIRVSGLLKGWFPVIYKRGELLRNPYNLIFLFTPEEQQLHL